MHVDDRQGRHDNCCDSRLVGGHCLLLLAPQGHGRRCGWTTRYCGLNSPYAPTNPRRLVYCTFEKKT